MALFKNKQLWGNIEDIKLLICIAKEDTIKAKYLRKFLNILNITDKNVIKKLDNIAEDKKLFLNK